MLTFKQALAITERENKLRSEARERAAARQAEYRRSQQYKNHQADHAARKALADWYREVPMKQLPDTFNPQAYYDGWADNYNNSFSSNWRGD